MRWLLGRRLPRTRGALQVPGIQAGITIRRDRWGIPYIEAASETDAWFGLGFCHGQDRAFQIEFLIRAVRGTVSEVVGPQALRVDRLSRRIGFHRAAVRQVEALEPELRNHVEAYVAGVERGACEGSPRRPHELVVLRSRRTKLTSVDVRAILSLFSFAMAANWDSELTRLRVLQADGLDALTALDPAYPSWLPVASPPGARAGSVLDRLSEDIAAFGNALGGGGSNNWVLNGNRTASSRPILANDPHLPPAVPCQWYLAHLRTPSWTVGGASFAGTPSFPAGHNDHAAWGVTAGLVDNTDLYLEEVGPDGRSVRQGDDSVPCEVLEERIAIRGREPVIEKILITPRGPIVGPALGEEKQALSLRATWLEARPVAGYLMAHKAQTFESFRRHFAEWPVFSCNVLHATADDTIGWQLAGDTPRRRRGRGLLPSPGSDPGNGWEPECVPFDEMPFEENPACGFLATANQKPKSDGTEPYLGADWIDGYRMARICEALEERSDWDVEGCLRLQTDLMSLPWREVRDTVLSAPASDPATARALEWLRTWDGRVTIESPAACIFEHFLVEMTRRCVAAKAPRSAAWMLGEGPSPLVHRGMLSVRRVGHLSRVLREQPPGWFSRPWPEEVADVLGGVVRSLEEKHGADPRHWGWGKVRTLTIRHPLGENRLLGGIFNLDPIPAPGDTNTVAQAAVDPFDPEADPLFVPSLRAVFDVGNWSASRYALCGGQSGNPFSPHYDDQMPLWLAGEGLTMAWSPEEMEAATVDTLRLQPQKRTERTGPGD